MESLKTKFKSVQRIGNLEEAKDIGADVVLVLDLYIVVPALGGAADATMDLNAVFLTPDNKQIEKVQAKGIGPGSIWLGGAAWLWKALPAATTDLVRQFESAMNDSVKLAEYNSVRSSLVAKSRTGEKVSEPSISSKKESATDTPTSDVDHLPTTKARPNKHAYAVVVGIEQYREKLPKADFADRDAMLMGEYLTKVLGYPEENVVVRVNDKAAKTDLEKYFEAWLPNNVEKDSSVFVYYSGHGAPNPKTGDAYLVPYDGDPTFVDKTGYPLKRLYAALEKLPAKDVTVVLDSCFSGAGGRSVLAQGAKPMVLSVENVIVAGGKTVVLSASAGDQISSAYSEKGHGLLTYFFLKGLHGEGDLNKDGAIEMAELFEYVKPNVQKVARKQFNNEQTPQLLANPELLRKGAGRLIERTQ